MHLFRLGSSYSSWKTHVNRKHPTWQQEIENRRTVNVSTTSVEDTNELHTSFDQEINFNSLTVDDRTNGSVIYDGTNIDQEDEEEEEVPPNTKRVAALFLLTFKEQYKLPQVSIDFAVGAINCLIRNVCDDVITTPVEYEDPFSSLMTEYQQTKFFREEFGLVVLS